MKTKNDYIEYMKKMNAEIVLTFKTPLVAMSSADSLKPLSLHDTDFFETEVLRQFYINMSRVVRFKFAAYPEERKYNSDTFTPLHYHAIAKAENTMKFYRVAPLKYHAVLHSVFKKNFYKYKMPREALYIDFIHHNQKDKTKEFNYELYCLKKYDPAYRMTTNEDFTNIKPLVLS